MRAMVYVLLLVGVFAARPAQAQVHTRTLYSFTCTEMPLRPAVAAILRDTGQQYAVAPEVPDVPITLSVWNTSYHAILRQLIRAAGIPRLTFSGGGVIVIYIRQPRCTP